MNTRPSRGTLLLVDDDPAILLTVGDRLQAEGYEVARVTSAEECLAWLDGRRPDLIILDIGLPGANGLTFLKQISYPNGNLRYPVLVFTARAELDHFFRDTRVDGFVAKTSDPEMLLKEVEWILDRYRRHTLPTGPAPRMWRVLIADDDAREIASLQDAFVKAGYVALSAADAYELIVVAVRERPDVMLIKQGLPPTGGAAVASTLSSMPRLHRTPVILYGVGLTFAQELLAGNVNGCLPGSAPADLLAAAEAVRSGTRPPNT